MTTSLPARTLCILCLAVTGASPAIAAPPANNPVFTDPAAADADFPFQGEYVGDILTNGAAQTFGVQVIARGDGAFDAVGYPGGLPGAGWTPPTKLHGKGTRQEAEVVIDGLEFGGVRRRVGIKDGALAVLDDAGKAIATFPKTTRQSPTLGLAPPADATVIFDGPGPVDETTTLVNPGITEDGLLMEGVTTRESFGDALWHVEFRLPYQPKDRGQARGNSGAYFLGLYEVQMLDSFGLEGRNNECGGVYSVAAPALNMCLPPLEWQTYDVEVTAAKFDGDTKVADARMTVRHNGVVIQDDVEVPKFTPGGPLKREAAQGPLHLQNHTNPVRYRNIWVLPKR